MIYRTFWMVLSILLMAVCSRGNATEVYKDPHHKGFLSSLNLGFRYSSVLQNRGIILYRGFQIDPDFPVFR